MTDTRFAFLIGAGASRGVGAIQPFPPPLGADLFGALAATFPESWGKVPDRLRATFNETAEAGMSEL